MLAYKNYAKAKSYFDSEGFDSSKLPARMYDVLMETTEAAMKLRAEE